MCLVAAGHPFDLIKVRLQTMQVKPGQAPPFTGALDCARQTVARDGVCWACLLFDSAYGLSPMFIATVPWIVPWYVRAPHGRHTHLCCLLLGLRCGQENDGELTWTRWGSLCSSHL